VFRLKNRYRHICSARSMLVFGADLGIPKHPGYF
jgi:hypothetical protein